MLRLFLIMILGVSLAVPEVAAAGSHSPFHSPGFYSGVRPVCPIGVTGPGCFAPVRKSARFVGRAGFFAARAVGRVAYGAARVVGRTAAGVFRGVRGILIGTGRFLFGRRYY